VHQNQILGNKLLNASTAGFRELPGQKLVEPFAGIVYSRRNQKWELRHAGANANALARPGRANFSARNESTYRCAAAGTARGDDFSHQMKPPVITRQMEINWVPVMIPPNTEPRPGSSRINSRKERPT